MKTSSASMVTIRFIIFSLVGHHIVESFTANNIGIFPVLHERNARTTTKFKSTNGMNVDAPTIFMNVFTTVNKDNGSDSPGTRLRLMFEYAPNGVCVDPGLFVTNDESEGSDDKEIKKYFTMRNVPGNGDCMFLAVALAAATSMGLGGNDALLDAISRETREVVAQVLSSPNGTLYIANGQTCKAQALLQQATRGEGLGEDTDRYLELLRKPGAKGGIQGGGPELTVLANILRRPISIYELASPANGVGESEDEECSPSPCPIVCKGTFGLDLFGDPCGTIPESAVLSNVQPGAYSWQLHILILDVSTSGDEKHACVLLPQTPI